MNRRLLSMLLLLLAMISFTGCKGNAGDEEQKVGSGSRGFVNFLSPNSTGRAYELLVVVDDALWERPAGRALYDVLDTDVPGLPQSERSFRVMHVPPSGYDATMKMVRNIIMVDIKDTYTQGKLRSATNVLFFRAQAYYISLILKVQNLLQAQTA